MGEVEAGLINCLGATMCCHCKLAAETRIRDLAKLHAEYGVCSYEEKRNELREKYNL